MVIYVDIDETICITPDNRDYSLSMPIKENIEKINKLYEDGNEIIYWTARGTKTGIDWQEMTKKQFNDWNVKYNKIQFNKPYYDLFICDKAINSDSYFKFGE